MKQYYSYENFRDDTLKLGAKLKSFKADAILGIARGGMTLSHAVAEGLSIREVQVIRTELYDDSCKRDELQIFGSCEFKKAKRVLVLDDIADSGETLNEIMKYLQLTFEDIEFKSATLFYKKTSIYEPDYWINEAENWIEFFWEKDFTF